MSGARALVTALIAAVFVATIAVWIASGDVALALAPLLLTLIVWALLKAPPHWTAAALFFLAIVVDNPGENPFENRWRAPTYMLGQLLYNNLNNVTGVQALRFAGMDVLLVLIFLIALARERRRGAIAPPASLRTFLVLAWLGVVWLELYGLARGGDFKASLWQLRPLVWAPVIAYVLSSMIRGPADLRMIGKAVIAAALIKAALATYYYQVLCKPIGHRPATATTHSDTVLFVTAAILVMTVALEKRTRAALLWALAILMPVGVGIFVNGRRLAYVSLAFAVIAIYLALPKSAMSRRFNRAMLALTPVTLAYLAIGWSSSSAVFLPARKVASLFSKDDRSSAMRDIENYNLLMTWKQNLLFGSGFGHEYNEISRGDDISQIFALYRYIGHNSVLWLGSVGGLIGFTLIWLLLVYLAYAAARSYRFTAVPVERAAALTALSVVVIFGAQAYGDMGLASWTAMFILGMSLAVASKLAVACGALPGAPGPSASSRGVDDRERGARAPLSSPLRPLPSLGS